MEKRVVITGMGVITPVGKDVKTFWDSLINGVCGIDFIKNVDASSFPVKIAGEIKDFDPKEHGLPANALRKNDLYTLYALAASNEAVADSGLVAKEGEETNIDPARFGVYVGSGIGGVHSFVNEAIKMHKEGPEWVSPLFIPTMIANIAAGNIAINNNARGVCLPVVTACATGTHAIGEAYRAIKHGYADAIIAGGSEASINPIAIGGFANARALSKAENPSLASLPFDARRGGFVIAEGAGVVVLEEYERAVARGAHIYAEVCGYGNTCDAYHYTAPRPDGSCAAQAIKNAMEEAAYTENDMVHINAHGTATPLNDASETEAIKLAFGEGAAKKLAICSTKSMTGHALGAAGGMELVAAALAVKNGIVPPTIGLNEPDPACDLNYTPNVAAKHDLTMSMSTSLGFGGHNAVVVLRKFD